VGDFVVVTEARHLLAGEVHQVVRDDGIRDPKVTYDVLLGNIVIYCLVTWRVGPLHPLGKVVRGHQ